MKNNSIDYVKTIQDSYLHEENGLLRDDIF